MSRKSFLNYKREKRQKMKIRFICILVVLLCCLLAGHKWLATPTSYLRSCHLWISSDKFADGSFSLHEHFSLLDFLDCFFLFVGELFGVVGELFF